MRDDDDYPTLEDVIAAELGLDKPATKRQVEALVRECGLTYAEARALNKAAATSLISDFVAGWQDEREARGQEREPEKYRQPKIGK